MRYTPATYCLFLLLNREIPTLKYSPPEKLNLENGSRQKCLKMPAYVYNTFHPCLPIPRILRQIWRSNEQGKLVGRGLSRG